jgi:hypothetical protein
MELTATVTAIDMKTRMVSLQSPGAVSETVYAGPEVRNLAQLKVGDVVTVSYYEALAAEVTAPEKAMKSAEQATAMLRAEAGKRPGGAVGQVSTTTLEIQSIDASHNAVTFRRPDGKVRTIVIANPDSQRFVAGLKRGDLVQVTYMEAVAVAVRAAP